MAARRMIRIRRGRSRRWLISRKRTRSSTGTTRSLEIIVLSATVATMIMAEAADRPPR